MGKTGKLAAVLGLTAVLLLLGVHRVNAADEETMGKDVNYQPYISLGADLDDNERETVLELLDVSEEELPDYMVVEVTNQEEHSCLGEYVTDKVIGSRALSSVKIEKMEQEYGIHVITHNINYCTAGMYCNALITAGITDARVIVAGPYELPGTAALVGVLKAYGTMTGQEISDESMDAATNELVLTGTLAEATGDGEKTEELIALVKQKVLANGFNTTEDIEKALEESSESLDFALTEEEKEDIVILMDKISDLDLDVDNIKEQAREMYDRLAAVDEDAQGFFSKAGDFLMGIFMAIVEFIKDIFS